VKRHPCSSAYLIASRMCWLGCLAKIRSPLAVSFIVHELETRPIATDERCSRVGHLYFLGSQENQKFPQLDLAASDAQRSAH
jgi:hypothetical protein